MNVTPNPFASRGVITDPNDFFGRETQLEEIVTRLHGIQSVSVVGERRIGKSSFLYHLAQTGTQRLSDESYRFIYLDLQDAHFHTANGFFKAILKRLNVAPDVAETVIEDGNPLNRNLIAFTDQLETLAETGGRIVLCLDEFEIVFKHPGEFTESFFDHLRSQLNVRKFAFVTATHRTLQTLCLEGGLTSPFYNLFTILELKEFTEREAQEFIAAHHARVQFSDDELQFISSYLDPHPLRLQILCFHVLENRQRQLAERALVEEIAKEYSAFFGDTFEPKPLYKPKKLLSPDNIRRLLEMLKPGFALFKGSDR